MSRTVIMDYFVERSEPWRSWGIDKVEEGAAAEYSGIEPERVKAVLLAFQGGGARGVSHVGGLQAVNDLEWPIKGVAGTSAGAIIAALVAAGYKASDLIDTENDAHLLERIAGGKYKNATTLFYPIGWFAIRILRNAVKKPMWCSIAGLIVSTILARIWFFAGLTTKSMGWEISTVLILVGVFLYYKLKLGITSLRRVRDFVDLAIVEALGIKNKTANITFKDMEEVGCIPLKLVATNITRRSLQLFSVETTPAVVVADAVAASICIPAIFKPWKISYRTNPKGPMERHSFIDGGIMSNLPVWPFDEERALSPHAITIAFGLEIPPFHENGHWLGAALNTVVSGPPEIHFRGVPKLVHVPLYNNMETLSFDAPFVKIKNNVKEAAQVARVGLQLHIIKVPAEVRTTLASVQDRVGGALRRIFPPLLNANTTASPLFRIALAIQKPGDYQSVVIAYESGHKPSGLGRRLTLKNSLISDCWDRLNPGNVFLEHELSQIPVAYPDSKWLICVPIENGAGDSTLPASAVVAIIDSPVALPDTIQNDRTVLDRFGKELYLAAFFEFGKSQGPDQDDSLGALYRRSFSWL